MPNAESPLDHSWAERRNAEIDAPGPKRLQTVLFEPQPPPPLPFVFGGLPPYVKAAAAANGIDLIASTEDARLVGKACDSWQAKQLQQQLSDLASLVDRERRFLVAPGSVSSKLDGILAIRRSLSVLLEAAEAAIAEVVRELDIDDLLVPTTDPSTPNHTVSETSDAPDDQSVGGGPGEHHDLDPGQGG